MTSTATAAASFTTLAGYTAAYKAMREEIMVRHGYAPGSAVRLSSGCITLLVEIGGRMVPYTSDNTDARDRVRLGGTFALRANA
jgi:hypothetical protein